MQDNLYSAFEEAFRGPRAEILARLSGYNELLAEFSRKVSSSQALDLGCGRGEWLEILGRHGYQAIGVDSNQHFVDQCLDLNLDVVCADIFSHLRTLPDHSFGLISCFHLIEHLSHPQLGVLLSEILRVLSLDGLLILETPSIDHLLVASKSFYSDPTHITPIHPEALCFALKQVGFEWSMAIYLNGGPETSGPRDQFSRVFQGVAQDVCLLASPVSPTIPVSSEARWQAQMRRAPTTLEVVHQYSEALTLTLMQLENMQRLHEDLLNLHEARFQRMARPLRGIRWCLMPLLITRRQMLRLVRAIRQPRQTFQQSIKAARLTARSLRHMVSVLLDRFSMRHIALLIYEVLFGQRPSSRPMHSLPTKGRAWSRRSQQIEKDLRRLAFSKTERKS